MEPENPEDRPESPKKKIRPSSTTNSDFQPSDSRNATDDVGIVNQASAMNGYVAPTRNFRRTEVSTSSERNDTDVERREASIQEEVVSSSENTVHSGKRPPSYSIGDADSLTNDVDESNHCEVDNRSALSHNSEAEQKEL